MSLRVSIRHRLLAVAALAAIAAIFALVTSLRMISFTAEQRLARGREALAQEVTQLAEGKEASTATPYVGLRGGVTRPGARIDVDPAMAPAVDEVIARARTANAMENATVQFGDTTLLVAARPARNPIAMAWGLYAVSPPQLLLNFRLTIILMLVAAALVVAASWSTVVGVRRGANTLNQTLEALASDLQAKVLEPSIPELAEVSAGIARLAAALAVAEHEQRRLSRELAERERLASLGRVVAGVAHEVRNPLAAIKLRLDLASTSPDTPPALGLEIERTADEIARLDRLVADLLMVAGRRLGAMTVTDLDALAKRRRDLLSAWARDRDIEIEVRGAVAAEVDADALARVVDNLIRNAVEASPRNAKVEIEIGKDGDVATIAVTDRGTGVDAAREAELFEPFFTTKPGGTGLGLAQSRAIAVAHGGGLRYRRAGKTTRFELTLPIAHATQDVTTEAA